MIDSSTITILVLLFTLGLPLTIYAIFGKSIRRYNRRKLKQWLESDD